MNKKVINILLIVAFVSFLVLSIIIKVSSNNKKLSRFDNNKLLDESYLNIDYLVKDNEDYTIVFFDSVPYVVSFNKKIQKELNNVDLNSEMIKLVGSSKTIDNSVMEAILKIYNKDAVEGTEDYLNKNDFNNIFGKYYMKIDRIISSRNTNQKSSFLSSLFLDLSLVSLFILGLKLMIEKRQTQTNN